MYMELSTNIVKKAEDIILSEDYRKKLQNLLRRRGEDSNKYGDNDYQLFMDETVLLDEDLVNEFIQFCLDELEISGENLKVALSSEKEKFSTYAFYDINSKVAAVYAVDRAVLDCLRSLAHELVHHKQNINNEIPKEQVSDENDGTPIENEANAKAGVIMRKFGRKHPELY